MKRKRFTEEQIAFALRQAESGAPVEEICRKMGTSEPTDNAFIESFNGRLRAECLNITWFLSLADARINLEEWRKDYNEARPHSALGNLTHSQCVLNGQENPGGETGKVA